MIIKQGKDSLFVCEEKREETMKNYGKSHVFNYYAYMWILIYFEIQE